MNGDRAIEEIARLLFAYEPGARSTRQVTADLTSVVVAWAADRGWTARTEARIEVPEADAARLGFVDVVIARGHGLPALAIEIDSADKPWSIVKLHYAAAAGMRPVWVRWGDNKWAVEYTDVDVIQLPCARRPADRRPEAQLGLWP